MTRKQVVLLVTINALISTLISAIVAAVLISRPEWVPSRLLGGAAMRPLADQMGGPEADASTGLLTANILLTPSWIIHTVESGDTLLALALRYEVSSDDIAAANGLDNPDAIREGMELIIPIGGLPEASATPSPVPTASSTPTMPFEPPSVQTADAVATALATPVLSRTPVPSGSQPQVEIDQVIEPGDLAHEGVVIANKGGGVANLGGWTLGDGDANLYVFSRLTLWPGGTITVYTRAGLDSADSLFWGKAEAMWSLGETATLKDVEGETVATHTVGQ